MSVTENSTTKDEKIMVRLNDVSFSKSYSEEDFTDCNIDERIVQEILNVWFEIDENIPKVIPKESLYSYISKLSYERNKPHDSEWFKSHLSTVRFQYVNKQLVPYRYSIHK